MRRSCRHCHGQRQFRTSKVFEALGAGAIDAINTPEITGNSPEGQAALLKKIDMVEKLVFGTTREKPLRSSPAKPRSGGQAR